MDDEAGETPVDFNYINEITDSSLLSSNLIDPNISSNKDQTQFKNDIRSFENPNRLFVSNFINSSLLNNASRQSQSFQYQISNFQGLNDVVPCTGSRKKIKVVPHDFENWKDFKGSIAMIFKDDFPKKKSFNRDTMLAIHNSITEYTHLKFASKSKFHSIAKYYNTYLKDAHIIIRCIYEHKEQVLKVIRHQLSKKK